MFVKLLSISITLVMHDGHSKARAVFENLYAQTPATRQGTKLSRMTLDLLSNQNPSYQFL